MNLFLAMDYKRAEAIIKTHSKTFYKAFSRVVDPNIRRGIYAVYAYCRLVDDAIDVHQDLSLLHTYKSSLDELIHGQKPKGFLWNVLHHTTQRYAYTPSQFSPFYQLIEGQEFDANPVSIQTMDQLWVYCDLVATSVGRMLMPLLTPNANEDHDAFAVALGRAFQLTNILRDVGEDRRRNRIYIPKEIMVRWGYSREDLWNDTNNDSFKNVMKFLIQINRDLYQTAEHHLSLFNADIRLPLHASLVLYRAILDEIESHQYDVFTTKQFVPSHKKKQLLQSMMSNQTK
jgi:phytoene synthase